MLATVARRYGITGAIVNGRTRDVTGLAEMSFPTFARGVTPLTSAGRLELVGVNRPVSIDGDVVEAGYFAAADANGVVFFPPEHAEAVLAEARRLLEDEIARLAAIRAGADPVENPPRERGCVRMREPLENQRDLFEILDGIAFFNCANMAPQLRSVRKAGERALARASRPWEIKSADWFTDVERLRALVAKLVGADEGGIAIVPSTSYGLAVAALNLDARPGSRVLTIAGDFPSAIYTWRAFAQRTGAEVRTVVREAHQSWTEALLEELDERVAVVSVPNVHWTNGALVDLRAITARARSVGAAVAIDATQSLGVMALDLRELNPDFLVAAGYKWLLGPFGLSYLYVAKRHRDGRPLEENWIARAGSEDFTRLTEYRNEYQAGARRFDVGQRTSFLLVPMAIAALEQLLEWRVERIASAIAVHTGRIEREAQSRGLAPLPAGERGPHMLGIRVPESSSIGLAGALAARGVYVGVRDGLLRVAPHLHTTGADVERLLDALAVRAE